MLFRHSDLPSDMECQEFQVVRTQQREFLPLHALLAALYSTGEISRPVVSVLNELAAQVAFQNTVTRPIAARGLLLAEAETRGFRLNAIFQESGVVYAQVGWEPECQSTRFHVCVVSLRPCPTCKLEEASWVASGEIGVSQILSEELRRIVPGNPMNLFSQAGLLVIGNEILQSSRSTASKE